MFVLIRGGDYYKGSTYVFQGQYFAAVTSGPADAKQYSSKARAKRAAEALNGKCEGIWKVLEVNGPKAIETSENA